MSTADWSHQIITSCHRHRHHRRRHHHLNHHHHHRDCYFYRVIVQLFAEWFLFQCKASITSCLSNDIWRGRDESSPAHSTTRTSATRDRRRPSDDDRRRWSCRHKSEIRRRLWCQALWSGHQEKIHNRSYIGKVQERAKTFRGRSRSPRQTTASTWDEGDGVIAESQTRHLPQQFTGVALLPVGQHQRPRRSS